MDLRGTKIGEVAALWRYPVRSLRGEKLDALEVALGGVVGDRAYGIADPEIGELVSSAQGKRRWRGLVTLSMARRPRRSSRRRTAGPSGPTSPISTRDSLKSWGDRRSSRPSRP